VVHGASGSDGILAGLEALLIPWDDHSTLIFETKRAVKFHDNFHHRVKIPIGYALGGNKPTEDSIGTVRIVDVDIAINRTSRHPEMPAINVGNDALRGGEVGGICHSIDMIAVWQVDGRVLGCLQPLEKKEKILAEASHKLRFPLA